MQIVSPVCTVMRSVRWCAGCSSSGTHGVKLHAALYHVQQHRDGNSAVVCTCGAPGRRVYKAYLEGRNANRSKPKTKLHNDKLGSGRSGSTWARSAKVRGARVCKVAYPYVGTWACERENYLDLETKLSRSRVYSLNRQSTRDRAETPCRLRRPGFAPVCGTDTTTYKVIHVQDALIAISTKRQYATIDIV